MLIIKKENFSTVVYYRGPKDVTVCLFLLHTDVLYGQRHDAVIICYFS